VLRVAWSEEIDQRKAQDDRYWLDMCLTPRPRDVRGGYPTRWGANRFERIGDVFIVPPGETMRFRFEQGRDGDCAGEQQSIVCRLDPTLVMKWFDGELEWTDFRLEEGLDIGDRSIRGLMMRLVKETHFPGFASETILDLVACQIAIELGRHFVAANAALPKGGLASWRLRLIDQRLKETGKEPTLTELAELCNISVRQLSRGFRTSRGCSIGSYVEQSRIEYAKRLLASGETIKKVSHLLGFSSASSFSYAFRRAIGASPAQFRQFS
jgi:AraC family transcriptional regulator